MNFGKKPRILLWGGKSQARIVQSMIFEQNLGKVELIFDPSLEKTTFKSSAKFINELKTLQESINKVSHFVVCIGSEYGYARATISRKLMEIGLKPINIISEHAILDRSVTIGSGCLIMPSAVVHKFSTIQDFAIVNTNATIDHEAEIGIGVHVMGSANLTGRTSIGNYATIGANATVLPDLKVGNGAIVGAGAVVTKNVEELDIVTGIPARYHSKNVLKVFEDFEGLTNF